MRNFQPTGCSYLTMPLAYAERSPHLGITAERGSRILLSVRTALAFLSAALYLALDIIQYVEQQN